MEEKIFDHDFIKKLSTINFLIKMKLSQGATGGRKSLAKGSSVEFSDYREYIQGDDFRRIDWNAYGRFEKLFIKLFMEEREAVFNIYLDSSRSMDFGKSKKSTMALKITASIAYIVLNNFDKILLHKLKDKDITTLSSINGKVAFKRLLEKLSEMEFNGKTELTSAIKRKDIKARGVSIIISDFFCKESLIDILKYLGYKKQEIILVQILSDEEVNPDFDNVVNLVDSETEDKLKVSLTPSIIKTYKKTLETFTTDLEKQASKYGANYVKILSDEPLEQVILKTFATKGLIRKV
ncbi:MAG: DUF58 domain-containing protein [Eubacteriales bacterium]